MPRETSSSQNQHILVGGLEIAINFAHHSDRERVIKAAQGVGWGVAQYEDDKDTWAESMRKMSLTFSMPRVWIPVHCLLLPGLSELQRSTYCYFRYKFYDQEAFCSQMKHPTVEEGGEEGQASVSFQGSRTVELRSTQPLMWYLREEKLEVQVWIAFKKDKTRRPTDTDRLVGSAFVDLSSLAKTPEQKLTLSGKIWMILSWYYWLFLSVYECYHSFMVLQECTHCSDAQQQIYKELLSEYTSPWQQDSSLRKSLLDQTPRWTQTTRWTFYQKKLKKQCLCQFHPEKARKNPPEQLQTSRLRITQKLAWMNLSLWQLQWIRLCISIWKVNSRSEIIFPLPFYFNIHYILNME